MIALIVLAGVASACLQLRARSLRARAAAAEAATREAVLDDLLHQAVAGYLPEPVRTQSDDGASRAVWTGELQGDPFEVTREPALAPNPTIVRSEGEADAPAARELWLTRWRATWRGHTIEEWRQS